MFEWSVLCAIYVCEYGFLMYKHNSIVHDFRFFFLCLGISYERTILTKWVTTSHQLQIRFRFFIIIIIGFIIIITIPILKKKKNNNITFFDLIYLFTTYSIIILKFVRDHHISSNVRCNQ
jgi:hypothetical protein